MCILLISPLFWGCLISIGPPPSSYGTLLQHCIMFCFSTSSSAFIGKSTQPTLALIHFHCCPQADVLLDFSLHFGYLAWLPPLASCVSRLVRLLSLLLASLIVNGLSTLFVRVINVVKTLLRPKDWKKLIMAKKCMNCSFVSVLIMHTYLMVTFKMISLWNIVRSSRFTHLMHHKYISYLEHI